jgi:hypothetical protein
MSLGAARIAVVAALVVVLGRGVAAQPAPTTVGRQPDTGYIGGRIKLEIDDCPPPPDLDPAVLKRRPSELFELGTQYYVDGKYAQATDALIAAYCLSPYFRVLKSIALAFAPQNEYEKAVGYYERYVLTIPEDVKVIDGINAADEKTSISSRIKVMRRTPAQITINSTPPGATVTLFGDTGRTAEGITNGKMIEVEAGRYAMRVALDGYAPVEQEITVQIGKPYAFIIPLERLKSRLRIKVTPGDARIFVDGRMVAQGYYEEQLSRDTYDILVEAPGRTPARQTIELSDNDLEVPIDLPPNKESGRTQLVVASGIVGASLGGVGLAVGSDDPTVIGVGAVGAAAASVGGAYFGIPDDYPLGSSSFIITSGVVGAGEGLLVAQLFTGDDQLTSQMSALGAIGGGTFAALTADLWDFSPGDAALLNTGALWGTVMGALFGQSYTDETPSGRRISAGLTLTGLNVGVLGGVLLGRQYEISRRHAALIDLAGVVGAASAAAIQGALDSGETDVPRERRANFAIGGVTIGLIAGAFLTRNMDAPKIPKLKPVLVPLKGADGSTAYGFGLSGEL